MTAAPAVDRLRELDPHALQRTWWRCPSCSEVGYVDHALTAPLIVVVELIRADHERESIRHLTSGGYCRAGAARLRLIAMDAIPPIETGGLKLAASEGGR